MGTQSKPGASRQAEPQQLVQATPSPLRKKATTSALFSENEKKVSWSYSPAVTVAFAQHYCEKTSAFSERYLGSPKLNRRAYEMSNLSHQASQFGDKKLLIIHPTADEKVHFQHTARFISSLISEKMNYSLQIYPDEGHFFHNDAARKHLSHSLVNFFEECFRLPEAEDLKREVESKS